MQRGRVGEENFLSPPTSVSHPVEMPAHNRNSFRATWLAERCSRRNYFLCTTVWVLIGLSRLRLTYFVSDPSLFLSCFGVQLYRSPTTRLGNIARLSISLAKPRIVKLQTLNRVSSELRSCVKIEVTVLGSPFLRVHTVSVDEKQH